MGILRPREWGLTDESEASELITAIMNLRLYADRVFRSKAVRGACMALGIALILSAARGDLWLDEVWSLSIAEAASNPWEILSVYRHDNNHVLNTFYLYLLGRQNHLILYRLLSVLSGAASLFLLSAIAKKWGSLERFLVVILAGVSYPLIVYFSEARGYAPAILFGLLALYTLEKYREDTSPRLIGLFWLAIIAGITAHLSFVIVLAALSVYALFIEAGGTQSFRRKAANIGKLLAVPFLFLIGFYFLYASGITIGGGPVLEISEEITRGQTYATGIPDQLLFLAIPVSVLVVAAGILFSIKQRDASWVFYASVIFVAPLAVLAIMRPAYFYFRYLVVTFPFFYLFAAYTFGRAYRSGMVPRLFLIAVLAAYAAGQAYRIYPFLEQGRGHYQKILTLAAEKTAGDAITIGSDHDFRNKILVLFYSRFLAGEKKIYYLDRQDWNQDPPEWIILHSLDYRYQPSAEIQVITNRNYRLTATEKFYGSSGFSWFLYHRESV